ncbi:hypothetical protein [Streptomyces lomondensis]|uniref:Integral membrane protein n=1 Tax=Streptomyces lomondensis TaxID=68229 RepID=A0ABQ2X086_9ACTN|nr:hypothetical protein [Streptomyces lomondensis]MCF0076090.1 hypothetical protein [Streptomyces lomondensis]GGW88875.1 hypothetical protein GCM10010383_17630 [Streptomyces lomondensis]
MGEWRLTRSLPGPAAEAGLGAVRRVHHARWSWRALLIAKLVLDAAMVPLIVRSLSELDADPGARPFAVFGWLLASWAALAYWILVRGGRRSYAVCDGGLLILEDGTGTTRTIAIPWHAVESVSPHPHRLHWLDGGKQRYVTLRTVTARDALIESVESRHPVPAPPAQRLLTGAGFTAVAAILIWALTLSPFAGIVMADRAYYLKDFASLCANTGTSYPESAPHTTTGPHPAALFAEEHGTDPVVTSTGDGKATAAPDPDDVQLVACSRVVRRQVDMICTYDGGEASLTFYRARYRIDVYEARTGRRIGAGHTVDADDTDSCPNWLVLNGKRGREEELAAPAEEEYQSIIDGVAAGRPA